MEETPSNSTVSSGSYGSYPDYSDSQMSEGSEDQIEEKLPEEWNKAVEWPTNSNFSIELGFTKIEELIATWERRGIWKHCIDFLAQVKAISCDYYFYEVMWSIPTNAFPIPPLTASVFFRICVNHLKASNVPVQVSYQLETQRFVHTPGKVKLQEKWLEDILTSKLMLYPNLSF